VDIWINGSTPDVTFDHARAAWLAVLDVATLAAEQPAFVYRDSRDLTGFIDGTANPEPLDAPGVALIPPGLPGECGSHVLAMRWVHDLDAFHALVTSEQERVVGRTKRDSIEFPADQMPPTAHIARTQVSAGEKELQIYRRSVPYGTVGEHGLYFVAFSADRTRYDRMLARMFGTDEDGLRD
jgi:putative iron-dependent peroxidase